MGEAGAFTPFKSDTETSLQHSKAECLWYMYLFENTGIFFCQVAKIQMSPAFVRPRVAVHKCSS